MNLAMLNAPIARLSYMVNGNIGVDWRTGMPFILHSKGNGYEALTEAVSALQDARDQLAIQAKELAEARAEREALERQIEGVHGLYGFEQRGRLAATARAEAAEKEVERLRGAWQKLDDVVSGAIKETNEPNRVFRDGRLVMEGEAADIYYNHLLLLRRMARAALGVRP